MLAESVLGSEFAQEMRWFGLKPACDKGEYLSFQAHFETVCLCCVREEKKKYLAPVNRIRLEEVSLHTTATCKQCDGQHFKPMPVVLEWGDEKDQMTKNARLTHAATERLIKMGTNDFYEEDGHTLKEEAISKTRKVFTSLQKAKGLKVLVHKANSILHITAVLGKENKPF